jgi:hypothetical protein
VIRPAGPSDDLDQFLESFAAELMSLQN